MIPDDELLMAYADGELDPITARRIEKAMQEDAALAAKVQTHRRLRTTLGAVFDPVAAEPVPERLRAPATNLAVLPHRAARGRWIVQAAAIAASMAIGIVVGTQWRESGPVVTRNGMLVASGSLADALDHQLAADPGEARMLISFKASDGRLCRVFTAPAIEGIACRSGEVWAVAQSREGRRRDTAAYRQAGSDGMALMAAAQEMMAGDPLDRAGEMKARAKGWR